MFSAFKKLLGLDRDSKSECTVKEYKNQTTKLDGPDISDIGIVFNTQSDIEILKKNSFPSKNGLFPNEIKLLSKASGYKSKENRFPHYWKIQFGLDDVQSSLKTLEKNGFIEQSSLQETLEKTITVPQLKEILREKSQKVSGKKQELVKRLLSLPDQEEIGGKFDNRPYKLTAKGENELLQNDYIEDNHYSVWDLNKWVNENPNKNWREIVEEKLIEDNRYYDLYLWFMDKKDYIKSFRCFLRYSCEFFQRFPPLSPYYYGLPDRDENKFDSEIKFFQDRLCEFYIPKLFYFQDLFSLTDEKFKELVNRELTYNQKEDDLFPPDIVTAFLFNDEKAVQNFLTKRKKELFS